MKKIVVIGSINIDLFVSTNSLPQVGETVLGTSFELFTGGKGANQAIAAARLGANVSFIGAVGADQNGKQAIKNFEDHAVDISGVKVICDAPTGVANVVACNGENSIIVVPGANEYVTSNFVYNAKEIIANSDILLVQNEIPSDGVKAAIEIANSYGLTIVYNPAPYTSASNSLCELVTYCTPNEVEANDIQVRDNLIITKGADGVEYQNKKFPAQKVKVIDTTGAGDTFNGALCASLAKDNSIDMAIKYGIKASAVAIQAAGAQTAMPYEGDLK